MKKAFLFIAMMALCTAAVWAVDVTTTGRVIMELVNDNNWSDFTSWDETDAPAANDVQCYGRGRVDFGLKAQFSENIVAVINTRFEGDDEGNKWMYFGKNNDEPGRQLSDAEPTLQEAYISFGNLFNMPLTWDLGRKAYGYGASNVMSDYDKIDGWRLNYATELFYVNLHYAIRERNTNMQDDEYCNNKTLMGLNAGTKNDMMDVNAYVWMLSEPLNKDDNDSHLVFGARGEFSLMEKMLMPFVEIALETGTNDATEVDYSGMLIDLGAKFNMDMGSGKFDALVQFLQSSGDDVDTNDKDETFCGVDMSNNIQGYTDYDVAAGGVQMIKVEAGFTPAAMDKIRCYLDFWMFNDATANIDDVSGENMWNEIALGAKYTLMKNVSIYGAFNIGMPNKDYMGGEDAAMAFTVGSQLKW